jgi:hypothetical protein
MSNLLPVPPELQHLIEKRETSDRRQGQRGDDDERQHRETGDAAPRAADDNVAQDEASELRSQEERRKSRDRRRNPK